GLFSGFDEVPREIGNVPVKHVETIVERAEHESKRPNDGFQADPRMERDVTIPRARVPPAQSLAVDVGGLKQGGADDDSRVRQKTIHVGEDVPRISGVLEYLEADDAIEAIGGTGRVAGDKGVVTLDMWETRRAERFREDAITPTVIENAEGP